MEGVSSVGVVSQPGFTLSEHLHDRIDSLLFLSNTTISFFKIFFINFMTKKEQVGEGTFVYSCSNVHTNTN